ncbi:50S ribosomal protein L6 [Patescibacteria group bacterium]|nr:50S ribosomal protein L6 [Patescibacteria group bacterium]
MSRIGKLPIELPKDTEAKIVGGVLVVKGPKGELKQKIVNYIKIEIEEGKILVKEASADKRVGAMWGLMRTLTNNMVVGVNQGFVRKLEVNGVGYKANAVNNVLTLNVGYSHPVIKEMPEGITVIVEGKIITLEGIDKQAIGETAAQIRRVRKPEPYKGKGIKYIEEVIIRKVGKKAGKGE